MTNYELSKLERISRPSGIPVIMTFNSSKGIHDIQNVVVRPSLAGEISITGELISGATATGVLVVVYSLTNASDLRYVIKQTEEDRISVNVTGLTGAGYGVSTFAIENGLPFPSVVTLPKNINITSNHHQGCRCIILIYCITIKGMYHR